MATPSPRAWLNSSSSANLPWSSLGARSEGTGGRRGTRVDMASETVAIEIPRVLENAAGPARHCRTEYRVRLPYLEGAKCPTNEWTTLYRRRSDQCVPVE